ncbi:MAG: septum formation initiator family protein [Oligoflexia bacterium]|nr:septum formation initiator family protein [Oligoflexia bacterium]
MKISPTIILFVCAVAVIVSLLSASGISRITALRQGVDSQRQYNHELEGQVQDLDRQVKGLQRGGRDLEKAAREKLGMSAPDEMIFIFDDKK